MRKILNVTIACAVLATTGVPVMAPAYAHSTTYYHTHHSRVTRITRENIAANPPVRPAWWLAA